MPVLRKYKGKCAVFLKKIPGLSSSERDQLLNKLVRFIEQKNKGLHGDKIDKSIKDFAFRMREEYKVDLTNRMNIELNTIKVEFEVKKFVDRFGKDSVEAIMALMQGSNRRIKGAKSSVNGKQMSQFMQWKSGFIEEIKLISGAEKALEKGTLNRNIMHEFYRQFKGHGKPSKNATVIKIAEVMHKYDQIIVNRLNKAGARIDRHPGFLFRMGHDKEKLVDFDAWKKDTKSLLDRKAM